VTDAVRELLIVGAGPAGLATAIAAHEAGLDYEVLEKGALVNSIHHFPRHMVFFTTADLLEIGGLPFVTPYEKPTQVEGLRYYRRVTETYGLRISLGEEVKAVRTQRPGRDGARFRVETVREEESRVRRARNVVASVGYYDHPNFLGVPGEDLPHVSHYYHEPHGCWSKQVVVVGGKNSAAINALELYRAGAKVTLVHHRDRLSDSIKYWIKPDIENRIKEGSIAARFGTCVTEIRRDAVVVRGPRGREEIPADAVFLMTGYHPDPTFFEGAGVRVDPETLAPAHDPQTLETNVPGFYVAGSVVSGKNTGRIFIENGRFHGEAIVKSILASSTQKTQRLAEKMK
jgi:bacillithiol disulfide reductase